MTLAELERNVCATLALAVIAGREDERFAELGGNAAVLLELLHDAGGLEPLVRRIAGRGARTVEAGGGG